MGGLLNSPTSSTTYSQVALQMDDMLGDFPHRYVLVSELFPFALSLSLSLSFTCTLSLSLAPELSVLSTYTTLHARALASQAVLQCTR